MSNEPKKPDRRIDLDDRSDGQQLVLVKNGQRFIFRYEPGGEAQVLEQMLDLARDKSSGFDAFDAAVLSHQMGLHLSEQLKGFNKAS